MKVAGIFFGRARGELAAANQNRSRKHVEFGEGIPEPHFSHSIFSFYQLRQMLRTRQWKSLAPAPRSSRHRFIAAHAISMLMPRTAATQIQALKIHLARTLSGGARGSRGETPPTPGGDLNPPRRTYLAAAMRQRQRVMWSIAARS